MTLNSDPEVAPEAFFASERTLAALSDLAGAPGLTLYCGAGVTRDRTGVGWDDLVREVFSLARKNRRPREPNDFNAVEVALDFALPAKQAASLVLEALRKPGESEKAFLRPYLQRVLYRAFGWQEGLILRNIAVLAVELATFGKRITIVTTNYDTYIEARILQVIEEYSVEGIDAPGVRLHVGGLDGNVSVARQTEGNLPFIEIYYPHGRIPETGGASADVVFSENSYSRSSSETVRLLTNLFSRSEGLVTLGASVNDDPLIEALTITKPNDAPHYALVDLPARPGRDQSSNGFDESKMRHLAASALRHRGNHLGLKLLFPFSHGQVAQFVDELRIASVVAMINMGEYSDVSYSSRLSDWWHAYEQEHQTESAVHETLRSGLAEVERKLGAAGILQPGEKFRLEMWLRKRPSASSNRTLALISTSSGPLREDAPLRAERVDVPVESNVASVKAFQRGKPVLDELTSLGFDPQASRWRTFLAVPITLEWEVSLQGLPVAAAIPIGVLTLASSHGKPDALHDGSALWSDSLNKSDYEELVRHLIGVGRSIAEPGQTVR